MIAHEKEKRLVAPIPNDVSKGHAIDIDSCFAARIVVTELRGGCAAKGVPGDAHLLQVEFACEPAGWVICIELLQLVEHKFGILNPCADQLRCKMLRAGGGGRRIEISSRRSDRNPAIGEGRDHGTIRRVETDDDVSVTRKVFRERRVIGAQRTARPPAAGRPETFSGLWRPGRRTNCAFARARDPC